MKDQRYSSTLSLTLALDGVVKATPRPRYPREWDPAYIPLYPWWAPGSVLTGAENLAPSQIRSQDRSIPRRGEIFRTCPDRTWSSPSLPYNGYRGPCMLTVNLHLALRLSMNTATSVPVVACYGATFTFTLLNEY